MRSASEEQAVKIRSLCSHALSAISAAVVLVACDSRQSVPIASRPLLLRPAGSQALSAGDLLYITSRSSPTMYVYSYPRAVHKRTVERHSFYFLYGDCADSTGRVYVLNYFGSSEAEILVYAHGATRPMRSMQLGGVISNCSVDPTSGDLAVMIYYPPGLAIYPDATGSPTFYLYPKDFFASGCTYDDKGNLFVDGTNSPSYAYASLLELPAAGGSFVNIALPKISESSPSGGVRWHGKELVLSDGAAALYRLAVHGSKARVVGTTQLGGLSNVWDFWIRGKTVVGSNTYGSSPSVLIWNYPEGGQPIKAINNVGEEDGVTVSVPPSH
jgi:hypothetical protein